MTRFYDACWGHAAEMEDVHKRKSYILLLITFSKYDFALSYCWTCYRMVFLVSSWGSRVARK